MLYYIHYSYNFYWYTVSSYITQLGEFSEYINLELIKDIILDKQ